MVHLYTIPGQSHDCTIFKDRLELREPRRQSHIWSFAPVDTALNNVYQAAMSGLSISMGGCGIATHLVHSMNPEDWPEVGSDAI